MTTKIKAIFRGQDGSLGYRTNKEYSLNLEHKRGDNISINTAKIEEMNVLAGDCEYESMTSFLQNWDNIRVIN
jgi:uncharacterized protein YaiE (UPF0345 family)